ncbi:MAG: tRNA-dihydrouridine synthase [Gammaproteobacteria bacterium]|jgi:tRNA-dihydrouridine synthase C|nr:tRNA-dihydrouridine synthase [Gammaproteobacteria bacterium]
MSRIILAPMEGLADNILRDCLTLVGGIDLCVTEFIRVTDQLLPERVFYRLCPELHTDSKTPAGVPVRVQLLGSHPQALGLNAQRALALGSAGVDLNFGCPAKTVNRSQGGAILLRDPARVGEIVATVREAIGPDAWLSAKMRLGYEDTSLAIDNAQAIAAAGANELVVHARTKVQGYRPPAHWHWIAHIRTAVSIPVIANGDIWQSRDYEQCRQVSGCDDVMLGRGIVWRPDLARSICQPQLAAYQWAQIQPLVLGFCERVAAQVPERFQGARVKQWLALLGRVYPEAATAFVNIKRLQSLPDIVTYLLASAVVPNVAAKQEG